MNELQTDIEPHLAVGLPAQPLPRLNWQSFSCFRLSGVKGDIPIQHHLAELYHPPNVLRRNFRIWECSNLDSAGQ